MLTVAFIIMNIDFIKEILMSTAEYWVVAKKTEYREYFKTVKVSLAVGCFMLAANEWRYGQLGI